MASGKTHDQSIFISLPGFLVLIFHNVTTDALTLVTFSIFYIFSGLYLSPDIDMKKSRPSQRWSILKVYWHPYRALFKHKGNFFNRNFFTHFPVIATTIRLSYFLFIPVTVLAVNNFNNWESFLYHLVVLFVACELASLVHLILDIVYTKSKGH